MFYFKSKSKKNLVAKVVTKPEFLVAKEKILVALVTILVAILSSAKAVFIMYLSPISYRIFSQPKRKNCPPPPPPSLDKDRRGYIGTCKHSTFLMPKFYLKALQQLRELTIFSGDTLDHVDCAIHYLEKQSVFDVDVDDVK